MQGQDAQKPNVISLFESRKKAMEAEQNEAASAAVAQEALSFGDVMALNAKNKERLEKERLTANKSVLRSYRIKN